MAVQWVYNKCCLVKETIAMPFCGLGEIYSAVTNNSSMKIFLVHFIIVLILLDSYNCNRILQSPMLTDWGVWGKWDKCPQNTFVIGMQLKVESRQQFIHDDTGLNGIRFICASILDDDALTPLISETGVSSSSSHQYFEQSIQSAEGPFGSWRTVYYCNNGVAVGFQMRSEPPQGKGDDTAANNLRIICSDGEVVEGEGTSWGYWTSVQRCPKRTAICGLQTQVQMKQGFGTFAFGNDDTGLNNLRVECCHIPNPGQNCTPSDYWELVSECDNTNAFTPTTCSYERRIGLGYAATVSDDNDTPYLEAKNNLERSILEDVGWSLGLEAKVLAQKFRAETATSGKGNTGFPWSSSLARSSSNIWNHEISTKVSFEVPPGVKSRIVQVVGTCGMYLVRTSKFQRIDSIEPVQPLPLEQVHAANETSTEEGYAFNDDHHDHDDFENVVSERIPIIPVSKRNSL